MQGGGDSAERYLPSGTIFCAYAEVVREDTALDKMKATPEINEEEEEDVDLKEGYYIDHDGNPKTAGKKTSLTLTGFRCMRHFSVCGVFTFKKSGGLGYLAGHSIKLAHAQQIPG